MLSALGREAAIQKGETPLGSHLRVSIRQNDGDKAFFRTTASANERFDSERLSTDPC